MSTQEAIEIIINEALSSALGDNNQEVLEALEVAREELEKLGKS